MNSKLQKTLICVVTGLYWLSQYCYIPYQTPYLLETGVAASVVGVVVGAFGFAELVCRCPIGLMSDIRPRHRLFIVLGCAAQIAGVGLRLLFPSPVGYMAGSFLSGAGGATWACFVMFFTKFYPQNETSHAVSLIFTMNCAGIFFGYVLGALVYDSIGMTGMMWIALGSSAAAFAVSLFLREEPSPRRSITVKELTKIYLDRRLILFSLILLIEQGTIMATVNSFSLQVARGLGAKGAELALCSLFYVGCGVVSYFLSGSRRMTRIGGKVWLPLSFAILVIYCVLMTFVNALWQIYLMQCFVALANGLINTFSISEAMLCVPPEKRSTAMTYAQAIYAGGLLLFPILVGMITDGVGITSGYYVLAGVAVLGGLMALILYRLPSFRKSKEDKN